MAKVLTSPRVRVANESAAADYAYEQGWTDGLPIIAPTPERVAAFLEYASLEPDQEIAHYEVRNRSIAAEKVAINAVMAGCEREHFPVVVAAIEAVTDHAFHLNHIASTSSPYPSFVVNGPIVEEIGLNSGAYVVGPGNRPNATIGRAISLVLANCMEARVGGVQQGVLGIPSRVGGMVIAGRENLGWEPLSVMRGAPAGVSAITAIPHFMGGPQQLLAYPEEYFPTARSVASLIAEHFTEYNSAGIGGTHLVLVSPPMQRRLAADGWSNADLRQYLIDNARVSFAKMKRRPGPGGIWPVDAGDDLPDGSVPVTREDYQRFWHMGTDTPTVPFPDDRPNGTRGLTRRPSDFMIAVAGADEGEMFACLGRCYPLLPEAATKVIRTPAAG